MRSTPRSGFPTSFRISSAKGCSPPPSFRSTPGFRARGEEAEAAGGGGCRGGTARARGVGARAARECCLPRGSSISSRRASREKSARPPSGWSGFSFPAPGFSSSRPGASGILNSHGRFFLSYAAPVIWNLAIIVHAGRFGGHLTGYPLAEMAAWASVAGSLLQFGIQLPAVLRLRGARRPASLRPGPRGARDARQLLAGLRGTGGCADQRLRGHPDRQPAADRRRGRRLLRAGALHPAGEPLRHVGLGGGAAGHGGRHRRGGSARRRAARPARRPGCARSPSSSSLRPWSSWRSGDVVTAALYQTGEFTREMTVYVWAILAGAAIGLLPSTLGRLYASTYYALHDTRTPLRFALIRVALSLLLGIPVRRPASAPLLGVELRWGAAGLDRSASGLAAWVEYGLLKRRLRERIGEASIPFALPGAGLGGGRAGRRSGLAGTGPGAGATASDRGDISAWHVRPGVSRGDQPLPGSPRRGAVTGRVWRGQSAGDR